MIQYFTSSLDTTCEIAIKIRKQWTSNVSLRYLQKAKVYIGTLNNCSREITHHSTCCLSTIDGKQQLLTCGIHRENPKHKNSVKKSDVLVFIRRTNVFLIYWNPINIPLLIIGKYPQYLSFFKEIFIGLIKRKGPVFYIKYNQRKPSIWIL